MAPATLEAIDVEIDCGAPGCDAGRIEHEDVRIHPDYHEFHLKNHAYTTDPQSMPKTVIGADCDCPRIKGDSTFGICQACKGTGKKTLKFAVPQKGQKVNVKDEALLIQIFGDEPPEDPGIVYDVQAPDEHHLELQSGVGIRVTWDRLYNGLPPKGKQVELWTFDLLELEIVR